MTTVTTVLIVVGSGAMLGVLLAGITTLLNVPVQISAPVSTWLGLLFGYYVTPRIRSLVSKL